MYQRFLLELTDSLVREALLDLLPYSPSLGLKLLFLTLLIRGSGLGYEWVEWSLSLLLESEYLLCWYKGRPGSSNSVYWSLRGLGDLSLLSADHALILGFLNGVASHVEERFQGFGEQVKLCELIGLSLKDSSLSESTKSSGLLILDGYGDGVKFRFPVEMLSRSPLLCLLGDEAGEVMSSRAGRAKVSRVFSSCSFPYLLWLSFAFSLSLQLML